jgi:hypothetical protein
MNANAGRTEQSLGFFTGVIFGFLMQKARVLRYEMLTVFCLVISMV